MNSTSENQVKEDVSCSYTKNIEFPPSSRLRLDWTPEKGVSVSIEQDVALNINNVSVFARFLENKVIEEMQNFDLSLQKTFIDLTSMGLEKRTDLSPSLEYNEIWVKPNTSELEFGTLFLTWNEPTFRTKTMRQTGVWRIQVNGLRDGYCSDLEASWRHEENIKLLAEKILSDEGTTILELSLTHTEEIQELSHAWNRANAAQDFTSEMVNSQHTPYTSVAKKLKEGITHSGRYRKTTVIPLTLPNKKSPAVLIRYHNADVAKAGRKVLNETLKEITNLPPIGRGLDERVQVWAKDPSIFEERNGGNEMREWLLHNMKKEAFSYSHKRKAYV